jgi:hypothetical protein
LGLKTFTLKRASILKKDLGRISERSLSRKRSDKVKEFLEGSHPLLNAALR